MKKILVKTLPLIIAATCISSVSSFAQGKMNTSDQLEVIHDSAEVDRKAIIALNVDLSEEESKAFWPVYNDYRAKMKGVNGRFIALLRKYSDNYKTLSDATASELITDYMNIEEDRLAYKKRYIEDLFEILTTKKVAVLFQLENKIEAALKYELSLEVPFVNLPDDTDQTGQ
jgi:hypothetical protein